MSASLLVSGSERALQWECFKDLCFPGMSTWITELFRCRETIVLAERERKNENSLYKRNGYESKDRNVPLRQLVLAIASVGGSSSSNNFNINNNNNSNIDTVVIQHTFGTTLHCIK